MRVSFPKNAPSAYSGFDVATYTIGEQAYKNFKAAGVPMTVIGDGEPTTADEFNQPNMDWTLSEIKEWLDNNGINYTSSQRTKADFLALMKEE